MKFYWFGDSWVHGDELYNELPRDSYQQHAFAQLVSDHYGADCVNLGNVGESVDVLPWRLEQIADQITTEDEVFFFLTADVRTIDRKSTRLNSSHSQQSRMPSSA